MVRGRIALLLHALGTAIERTRGRSTYADRVKDRAVRLVGGALRFRQ